MAAARRAGGLVLKGDPDVARGNWPGCERVWWRRTMVDRKHSYSTCGYRLSVSVTVGSQPRLAFVIKIVTNQFARVYEHVMAYCHTVTSSNMPFKCSFLHASAVEESVKEATCSRVRRPSFNTYFAWRSIALRSGGISIKLAIKYKYSSFECELLEKISRSWGQRSGSYVYKCVNAVMAEEYISMVWRRGSAVLRWRGRSQATKWRHDRELNFPLVISETGIVPDIRLHWQLLLTVRHNNQRKYTQRRAVWPKWPWSRKTPRNTHTTCKNFSYEFGWWCCIVAVHRTVLIYLWCILLFQRSHTTSSFPWLIFYRAAWNADAV